MAAFASHCEMRESPIGRRIRANSRTTVWSLGPATPPVGKVRARVIGDAPTRVRVPAHRIRSVSGAGGFRRSGDFQTESRRKDAASAPGPLVRCKTQSGCKLGNLVCALHRAQLVAATGSNASPFRIGVHCLRPRRQICAVRAAIRAQVVQRADRSSELSG